MAPLDLFHVSGRRLVRQDNVEQSHKTRDNTVRESPHDVILILKRWKIPALIAAGIGGSLTNTLLVLGMIGVLGFLPWAALPASRSAVPFGFTPAIAFLQKV